MKNFEYIYKNGTFYKSDFDDNLKLSEGEVLVSTKCIGICGSDLYSMEIVKENDELRLGHEWVGEVVESRSAKFLAGDMVTSPAILGCGECKYCLSNRENNCLKATVIGGKEIGAMRKYLKISQKNLIKIENMDLHSSVLVEVAAVADQAFNQIVSLGLTKESELLIFGCGPIGVFCALKAKEMNLNYKVVEINPYRVEIAKKLNLNIESTGLALMNEQNYMNFDYIIDCSGDGNKQSGFWKYFLHFSCVGVKALIVGKYINSPIINSSLMANRDALIKWMRGLPVEVLKASKNIWKDILSENKELLISHTYQIEDINEAFKIAMGREKTMKVILEMS